MQVIVNGRISWLWSSRKRVANVVLWSGVAATRWAVRNEVRWSASPQRGVSASKIPANALHADSRSGTRFWIVRPLGAAGEALGNFFGL